MKHLTKVKVFHTEVKFFNQESNSVIVEKLVGKITAGDLKTYVKELNKENVFISRELLTEEFNVNTAALYELKEVEVLEWVLQLNTTLA